MWTFFGQGKNGRKQPYIMYFARARTWAHNDKQTGRSMHTLGKHEGCAAAHRKKQVDEPFPTRKTTETR